MTDFGNLSNLKEKGQWAVAAGWKYGKIFKHTPKFVPEVTEMTSIYELNISQQTDGRKVWHQYHGFPIKGVSVLYGHYGNAEVFGRSVAVVPSLTFVSRLRRVRLHYRIGVGLSYLTKYFDRATNPVNNVIGSAINNTTMFMGAVEWTVHPQWRLMAAADFIHYSNAKVQYPNLGINVPTLGLMVKHFPNKQTFKYKIHESQPIDRSIRAAFRVGVGFQEAEVPGGARYHIYIGALSAVKRVNHKGQFLAGIEWNYYMELLHFVRSQTIFEEDERKQALKVTPYIGYEFLFGRLSGLANLGYYVYDPFKSRASFYTKIGLQYYIWDTALRNRHNLFAGVYLKSHYAQADYLEVGLGYVF